MSKVRVPINPLQRGAAGAYSMYVRDGVQVIRQRRNNSNYGAEASRSITQQNRRVRWANVINSYKAMAAWMPKAFENRSAGVTDYNRFVQLNINNADVFLTKEMAQAGMAICTDYIVSQGTLPAISYQQEGPGYVSNIKFTTFLDVSATSGTFAAEIIANNPEWHEGDNLAFVQFLQIEDDNGMVHLETVYREWTLHVSDSTPWRDNPLYDFLTYETQDFNAVCIVSDSLDGRCAGFVMIHTRQENILKVSSQSIIMVEPQWEERYKNYGALVAAIASYGTNGEVPLDPSGTFATVQSVYWEGGALTNLYAGNADVPNSVSIVYIAGTNLSGGNLTVTLNNQPYRSLVYPDGKVGISLQPNSSSGVMRTYQIFANGLLVGTLNHLGPSA